MKSREHVGETRWVIMGCVGVALFLSPLGCAGDGQATEEAKEQIAFRWVNNIPVDALRVLVSADDQDPERPGIQVNVRVVFKGEVWPMLRVGNEAVWATAGAGGEVVFEGVTLPPGETEILAVGRFGAEASLKVVVRGPRLEIHTKADTLGCYFDDLDPTTPGVQFLAGIRGFGIPDGSEVTLTVADTEHRLVLQGSEASVMASVPFASARIALGAQTRADGGTIMAERLVGMQCAGCAISEVGGHPVERASAQPVILGLSHGEVDRSGLRTSVTLGMNGLGGTAVELWVDDILAGTATPGGAGQVTFDEVFVKNDSRLLARCIYDGVEEWTRRAVRVDLTPPDPVTDLRCESWALWLTCTWTEPATPPSSTSLASWSLRYGLGEELDEESFQLAREATNVPPPVAPGTQITAYFPMAATDACEASFGLRVFDQAWNGSVLSNLVSVDLCRQ